MGKIIVIFFLLLSSCSTLKSPKRLPASYIQFSKENTACETNSQCVDGLSCIQNVCRVRKKNLKFPGEYASSIYDCDSNSYKKAQKTCEASGRSLAANDVKVAGAYLCISERIDKNSVCIPSPLLRGLADQVCTINDDCLSKDCDQRSGTCNFGRQYYASCAKIGEEAFGFQCCSGLANNGVCSPIADGECTRDANCKAKVGATCADIGTKVSHERLCCSGHIDTENRCDYDYENANHFPCSTDVTCPGGTRCNLNKNLCE